MCFTKSDQKINRKSQQTNFHRKLEKIIRQIISLDQNTNTKKHAIKMI